MNEPHKVSEPVPLPKRMRRCARDRRGMPIPYLMMPDSQVTMDMVKMVQCFIQKKCMICGQKLDNKKWFIGGQAASRHRLFTDPAMHEECARYAMRICPFLTHSEMKYRKKYEEGFTDPHVSIVRSPTQVLMQTTGYKTIRWRNKFYALANRWRYLEHWRDGAPVETPVGLSARDLLETVGSFDLGGIYHDEMMEP